MKLAIIGDALDDQYAGIHVYTLELIEALARQNSDLELMVVRLNKGGLPDQVQEIVLPLGSWPGAKIYRLGWQIPQVLRKMGVDAVIEPRHVGPFRLPKPVKRITVIHDLTWLAFPAFQPFLSRWLQRIIVPGILRRADLILTNSRFTRLDLEHHFPYCQGKTLEAIPGRDEQFVPRPDPPTLQRLGIRVPYFLFVGTLEPRKNLVRLLEAYRIFRANESASIPLVLVGRTGWHLRSFERAYDRHPFRADIIRLGYVSRPELMTLYTEALGFLYPSLFEGFGLPVLEAFCCGAPVITSDRTSLLEVAGPAALLVNPEDAQQIARAMQAIWLDPGLRQKLSRAGLERSRQFSWDKTAKRLIEAIVSS